MEEIKKAPPILLGIMVLPPLNEKPYLIAGRCSACGRAFFPKKEICPSCFDKGGIEEFPLSPRGKLATFTIVRRSLGAKKLPYALGYIETPENLRIFAPLEGCDFDRLTIGMEMEVVFEEEEGEEGRKWMTYKFRPEQKE
jgi:uncharacterized OB-fold protein